MNKKKILFFKTTFIILFILVFQKSFGQGRLGILAGTGIIYYNGDIDEKTSIITPPHVFHPFFRAGLNYRIGSRVETSLIFLYGNVGGADSIANDKDNKLRNQSFKSVIEEVSLLVEFHLFSVYRRHHLNPFLFAGAGIFHFNPTAQHNGVTYELQPLGTEGQYLTGEGYPKPYKLTQVSMPVGFGLYFQLSDHWRLKIDYANHFTFTDYLDDVSTYYPDSTLLANSPNGALAVAFSSRRIDGYPHGRRLRGDSKHHDSFSHIGVTILYNPGVLHLNMGHHKKNFVKKNGGVRKGKTLCPDF